MVQQYYTWLGSTPNPISLFEWSILLINNVAKSGVKERNKEPTTTSGPRGEGAGAAISDMITIVIITLILTKYLLSLPSSQTLLRSPFWNNKKTMLFFTLLLKTSEMRNKIHFNKMRLTKFTMVSLENRRDLLDLTLFSQLTAMLNLIHPVEIVVIEMLPFWLHHLKKPNWVLTHQSPVYLD